MDLEVASTSRTESPHGRKRAADSTEMREENIKEPRCDEFDDHEASDIKSTEVTATENASSSNPTPLRDILSSLRSCKDLSSLGESELELLCVSSYMKQNILPGQFLKKYMGEDINLLQTIEALKNLKETRLLQQQDKIWTITSLLQDKIRNLIAKNNDGENIRSRILEKALNVLISELNTRKEGHLPYITYIQDLIVSGMEIWENIFPNKDLVAKYFISLGEFAVASYEEMPTPAVSILFSTKAIRQLCRHFGQNDAKALSMKMCMTTIQARNGKTQQALDELDEYAQIMETSDDAAVRALLYTALEKKAYILKTEEKNCDAAINICNKILSLDKSKFEVDISVILRTKLFKCRVLNSVGQFAEAIDLCDDILAETKNHESLKSIALEGKCAIVNIFVSMEKNDLALSKIEEIIVERTNLFGHAHSSVLEARTQKAEILEDMTRLDESLEELRKILEIIEDKYGPNHESVMQTKSNIARVLACKGELVEATILLNNMLDIITLKFGPKSKEMTNFLEFKSHILRVNTMNHCSTSNISGLNHTPQLTFQESLNIYSELKRYYIEKYALSNFDSNDLIENIALHHFREGNWSRALADAEWIFKRISEELGENHQGLEHPLSVMSEAYRNLNEPVQELRCLELLYRVKMLNYGECMDTLNTLTKVATLQNELKKHPNALISYEIIYKLSVPSFGETHEKSITALYKVAKLQLKLLLYEDALNNFEKVGGMIRRENLHQFNDLKLKVKYRTALCHLKLSNVEEARTISKEAYDDSCWGFGEENDKYLNLHQFCQNVYERQKRSAKKFGKFFQRYKPLKYFSPLYE